jgi:hypothetical protein
MREPLDSRAARAVLERVTRDLLYMSESDEPVEVIQPGKPGRSFGAGDACLAACRPPSWPVRVLRLEEFFEEPARSYDWHGASERATVSRYRRLRRLFQGGLKDARAFRLGELKVDLVVVGRSADDCWIGIKTRAVET